MNLSFKTPLGENFFFALVAETELLDVHPHSEELALLSKRSSERRKRAFVLGRTAAQIALQYAGLESSLPVLRGARSEPLWPEGFVGSISHSHGYGAAVVARREYAQGIGIDLERITDTRSPELKQRVCSKKELAWIEAGSEKEFERFTLLFSAKESFYKALSPLTKKYLGFRDVEIVVAPGSNIFAVVLQKDLGPGLPAGVRFSGEYQLKNDFVLTALAIR